MNDGHTALMMLNDSVWMLIVVFSTDSYNSMVLWSSNGKLAAFRR